MKLRGGLIGVALVLLAVTQVRANFPCAVQLLANKTDVCIGESVTVTVVRTICDLPVTTNLVYSYSSNGTYTVSYNCTDCDGNISTGSLDIHVTGLTNISPATATMCPGSYMTFTGLANPGSSSCTPTWAVYPMNAGTLSAQGNIATFTLSSVYTNSTATLYAYWCNGTNTATITVTTNDELEIISQPVSQVGCIGQVVTFSVVATGSSLQYQWRKDGVPLTDGPTFFGTLVGHFFGTTNSTLIVTNIFASTSVCQTLIGTEKGLTFDGAAKGDTYSYQASGCIGINEVLFAHPDGNMYDSNCTDFVMGPSEATSRFACPGFTSWSLVGQLGTNLIQLGTSGNFQFPTSAVLSLQVLLNDYEFHDNSGSWDVCLTHTVEGVYDCVVTSDCGSQLSTGATLFVSTPCDGIPDWWRLQYFGTTNINNITCAACDPDGDGYSNLQEYLSGTDPTNSASYPTNIPPNLPVSLPYLVCPPTVIVSADSTSTNIATNVNLGQPAMIGCGSAIFSSNAPTSFPIGTTSVTWTAVCGSSITSQCSQTVIVLAAESCTNLPGTETNGIALISVTSNQIYQYSASGCVFYWPKSESNNGTGDFHADPGGTQYTNSCAGGNFYRSPEQQTWLPTSFTCPGSNFIAWSLVGKVSGSCYQLGNNGSFTPSDSGTLTVYFNDDNYGDNTGSFYVCASLLGPSGITLIGPTNGQTCIVDQPIALAANAYTSTGTITKVQFLDITGNITNQIGQSTSGPFYFVWPGTNITAGVYVLSATASNSLGNFYSSNVVTINVDSAISVTISSNLVLCAGSTATYVATPSGTGPFTYSWSQNDKVLSNETSNTLILDNVSIWDNGTIGVSVKASNAIGAATATLTVGNTPIANDQAGLTTQRGMPLTITLTGSDPSNASLTYTTVSGPINGTLSGGTGTNPVCVYTPSSNFVGMDSFSFKVNNGTCDSAPATVSIQVLDDIWLVFFDTANCLNGAPNLSLMITSFFGTTGTVSYTIGGVVSNQPFLVTSGKVTNVEIPVSMMVTTYSTIENNGIHVTASQPVSVSAMNYRPGVGGEVGSSGAFAAYPTSMFGTNYCLMGYAPAGDDDCPGDKFSQFAIVATTTNTLVAITPSASAHLLGHDAITPIITNLNQGQTYQLASTNENADATGTLITSGNPIGVLAGAKQAEVPNYIVGNTEGTDVLSPLMEEQLPVNSWGMWVPAFPLAGYQPTYRVLAASDNTVLTMTGAGIINDTNGDTIAEGVITNLLAGQFVDFTIDGPIFFQGSKPIQVAQLLNGTPTDDDEWEGDSEILMLPIGHYLNAYTVAASAEFATNFLNLIVEQSAIQTTLIDGQKPMCRFQAIANSGFYGAQIPVTPGEHTISSSRPIEVQIYGYNEFDAYSYNGGISNSSNVTLVAVADVTNAAAYPATVTIDVLTNDLFISRDDVALSIVSGSGPTHGTVVTNSDKTVTYSPTSGYSGDDQFTYQITEQGQVSTAPVTISINNHAPVASNDNVTVCYGSTVIDVLANDSDPDGDQLSILSIKGCGTDVDFNEVSTCIEADVKVNPDNTITYTMFDNNGADSFTYTVTDQRGGTSSATVNITLYGVIVNDATVTVCGVQPKTINLLDTGSVSGPSGATLTIAGIAQGNYGQVTNVGSGNVIYTPGSGFTGSDQFTYTASDGPCSASGTIYIRPPSNLNPCGTNVTVDGDANCYASVPNLTGDCSGMFTQSPTGGTLIIYGGTNIILTAIGSGNTCTSRVTVVCTNGMPVASISTPAASVNSSPYSPQAAVISDGILVITGSVYQTGATFSNVTYKVVITDMNENSILDSGWYPATYIITNFINTVDLTTLPNGAYDVELIADNGSGNEATSTVSIVLSSSLKIGQFSFSQQDVTIPVSGIPLTVTRTYNSLNPDSGDFGHSWTYALADLDVQIDEERTLFSSKSVRTGGGRDVTLNLPDGSGRRVTFAFQLIGGGCGGTSCSYNWVQPPGVYATLTPIASAPAVLVTSGEPWLFWQNQYANGSLDTNYDQVVYDFPGFTLTMPDGTQFNIQGDDLSTLDTIVGGVTLHAHPYINQKLTSIVLRNGDTLTVATNGISFIPNGSGSSTKGIVFTRDGQNHINAIYDPLSLNSSGSITGPAAAAYVYDVSGNLITVSNMVSRSPLQYNVTQYTYTNGSFPHYITSIIDPSGHQPLENIYDTSGRLIGVVDAFGNTNSFSHDVAAQTETVTDRMGNQTVHIYDTRGNIVSTTDASGTTTRMYDGSNNLLTETDPLSNTTTYTYDNNGNRTRMIDPLGHTNSFTYDSFGSVLTQTDALNRVTINTYTNGSQWTTTDPLGNTTSNQYDSAGNRILQVQMTGSLTVLNTSTFNYDSSGNLLTNIDAAGHATIYTYDGNGNQLTETTTRTLSNGGTVTQVTTSVYDGQNRLIATIDPLGSTNQVFYNAIGKQDHTIDKLGHTTSYVYDLMGQLTEVDYPDFTSETYAYDADGRRVSTTDRGDRTTYTTYDAVGRQILTIYPDGATVSNTYDAAGRLTTTTDARTNTTGYVYDAAGRRSAVTNAVGTAVQQVTRSVYDAVGNLITNIDANAHTNAYVYDALNRQIETVYPDSTTQLTFYDALGRRTNAVDQAGAHTSFGYDVLGRLTAVTNALTQATRYFYDELGNLTNQVDANTHATGFGYDSLGRRITRTLPLGMIETNAYDAMGNLVTNADFNGHKTVFTYDAANRLLSKTLDPFFGQPPITYTYTPSGQRATMVDNSGSYTYAYDLRDRLTSKIAQLNSLTLSLAYQYDLNGNLTQIQSGTSGGTLVSYQYDALNRLKQVTDMHRSQNLVTTNSYDAVGNLTGYHYTNGVDTIYSYNSLNHMTNMLVKTASGTLASYGYTLGPANGGCSCSAGTHITGVSEVIGSASRTVAYGYDMLYRLTNETISADSVGPTGNLDYLYDSVGNRTNRISSGAVATPVSSASYAYDSNDRLTADNYDNNGNTTNSAGNPYRYDFENRLTNYRNRGAIITYDGEGNRVQEEADAATTFYLIDDKNPSGYSQVLEELTSTGGATNLSRVYTYGQSLISQDQANGGDWVLSFYGYDGHGNVRFLINNSGTVTDTYTYDAFGNLIHNTGTTQNDNLYTGEQYDSTLGTYYLRQRHLNPVTGRFLTQDTNEGDQGTPQSLNKYAYTSDDPVDRSDPSGEDDILTTMAALDTLDTGSSLGIRASSSAFFSPGPDITKALQNTLDNIKTIFSSRTPAQQKQGCDVLYKVRPEAIGAWDIYELHDIAKGEFSQWAPVFGGTQGTPPLDKTVQFQYGSNPYRIYEAGEVNYAMYGLANKLCDSIFGGSAWKLDAALNRVAWWKDIRYFGGQKAGAEAFTRFGYDGTSPEKEALNSSNYQPNPKNITKMSKFTWAWLYINPTSP